MDNQPLLARFSSAVAAGDGEGFAALFTPDGHYHDGFFGPCQGRAQIAAMLARFHVGGEAFAWQFVEPLASHELAYARYVFSYRSREPQIAGRLIAFDGIARLRLAQGLIADYGEAFDRGVAFTQMDYASPRVLKLLTRYRQELDASDAMAAHLAWRAGQGL